MTARLRHLRHRDLDGIPRGRLDHLQDALKNGNVPGRSDTHTFTADATTNQITVASQDDLATGNPKCVVIGDDLPGGLETGELYFLRDAGTNVYTLHPSLADAVADTGAVDITDAGSGTLTLIIL